MSRASGTDRASRSSSGTTRVSPARTACEGLVEAGPAAVGAGQSLVQVDPVGGDAESGEGLALGGEVLGVGGAAGVADQRGGHVRQRTDSPPTSETITGRAI
jgi:hypothetical protein